MSSSEEVDLLVRPEKVVGEALEATVLHDVQGGLYLTGTSRAQRTKFVLDPSAKVQLELARLAKERMVVVTVFGSRVTEVRPCAGLRPAPGYAGIWEKDGGLSIVAPARLVSGAYLSIRKMLCCFSQPHGSSRIQHKVVPVDYVDVEGLPCGCCAKLVLPGSACCRICQEEIKDVVTSILGYYKLMKDNLQGEGGLELGSVGRLVTVTQGGRILYREDRDQLAAALAKDVIGKAS